MAQRLMICSILLAGCLAGCSKHIAYETVESMRVQQCLERRDDPDCPTERQRYEDYDAQRQRAPQE
jgi:hypothetical protein